MKVRNGFVSNSSSSSFVLFGAWTDDEPSQRAELRKKGIHWELDEESGWCVGVDPDDMDEEETLAEFRKRVSQKLHDNGIDINSKNLVFTGGSCYNY